MYSGEGCHEGAVTLGEHNQLIQNRKKNKLRMNMFGTYCKYNMVKIDKISCIFQCDHFELQIDCKSSSNFFRTDQILRWLRPTNDV